MGSVAGPGKGRTGPIETEAKRNKGEFLDLADSQHRSQKGIRPATRIPRIPGPHRCPAGVWLLLATPLFFQELLHGLCLAVASLTPAHCGGGQRESSGVVVAAQMPPGSCSGCGPLSLQLLAGLLAADAVVSLLIVGVVFACARPRPLPQDTRVYSNMPRRG
ncbi:hematopoietic cell signal transducer [Fukomys damarensis]|uniref:hematopoietic cell signal transducer n=1 Tax=Fukomys damarensis TaxID=885580 RepID=UPI00053F3C7B|nr:hematopoietic cell signal transducer [Fukomys damarensis]